jgi:hypothetical protein
MSAMAVWTVDGVNIAAKRRNWELFVVLFVMAFFQNSLRDAGAKTICLRSALGWH